VRAGHHDRDEEATLDTTEACSLLNAAGFRFAPPEVRVEPRDRRWAVLLPGDRMAWFPMDEAGRRRLTTERRVLRLLADRCSFRVPRVLFEADAGWDVRASVPGVCDPWGLYRRTRADRDLARRLGRAVGAVLAEQHRCAQRADVKGWLPEAPAWPEPAQWIGWRLPDVVTDTDLLKRIGCAIRRYENQAVATCDRVLIHGDIGFHNMAIDPHTAELVGIFDYDGAAWADRHHDFRYLVFDTTEENELESALAVYEPALGVRIERERIRLYNAVCAISYLAFRRGTPPEARSCGRTLDEDLRWVHKALLAIGIC